MSRLFTSIVVISSTVCFLSCRPLSCVAEEGTVKVFILAGQSNMEGKAKNELLEHQAQAPETKELFEPFRNGGKWNVRDDVFIKYLNRKGGLTVGYGSPGRTGVELEFGTLMGNHYEEPVLLIKTAWGGHSLFQKFRSPSSGLPSDEQLETELKQAVKRTTQRNQKNKRNDPLPTMAEIKSQYGSSYRNMMSEVQETFTKHETMFPTLKDRKLELAGFVWFQGWNDQYGGAELEYAANMANFIKDIRKDLNAPNLPFIIGVMGQNGSEPAKGAMLAIQNAQIEMETLPEFKGNVKAVRTDVLVDKAAENLYPKWKDNFEEWKLTGSDRKYHYLGSAIWFNRIGRGMFEAMLDLNQD